MPIEVRSLAEWQSAGIKDLLSVVIPAHNEEGHLKGTILALIETLSAAQINFEILVVNDNSHDDTERVLLKLCAAHPQVRYISNLPPNRFGFAVRAGLAEFRGDAVAVFMADNSDDPADLVRFYRKFQEGYDCVFGSRFMRGGSTIDYPLHKLILNRMGNLFIRSLFLSATTMSPMPSNCMVGVDRGHSADSFERLQSHRRIAAEMHRARLPLCGGAELVAQSQGRHFQVPDS